MKKPVLLINYKAYNNSYGKKAVEISKEIERVSELYPDIEVILCVPAVSISDISRSVSIPVFAQHIDAVSPGAQTGHITAEMIADAGAAGSLINHSEMRVEFNGVGESVKRLSSVGLESVVCVDRNELVAPAAMLGATAILVEPPELIGSGISVSNTKPEVVINSVAGIKKAGMGMLLVGAGITSFDDAKKSIELGADGVGLASAVMKASDPAAKVKELLEGIKNGNANRLI
ncbi:MAG: triose-phosphate isomerase [Nitrososphaerota archaeon]|jgi:triosephosphate isomerase|nr:triose-phosphate isomerase [Nitrososphaerota archaeon]MDG6928140.1 triose-phosphate isomerase [Nitrososphaerota archaeon]MDG6930979.1 triose-phosphate isomerase [Nitrososphaerota archaeon]MDG6932803.1 triose-phosphate isomerase [Nitrososphaerota archaeon]MDG6935314.1 triose-phosphate isomerase [Nitrososphaerota archaeon]